MSTAELLCAAGWSPTSPTGASTPHGVLFVIDGGEALTSSIRQVSGVRGRAATH